MKRLRFNPWGNLHLVVLAIIAIVLCFATGAWAADAWQFVPEANDQFQSPWHP
jgi:hypothetical protein